MFITNTQFRGKRVVNVIITIHKSWDKNARVFANNSHLQAILSHLILGLKLEQPCALMRDLIEILFE